MELAGTRNNAGVPNIKTEYEKGAIRVFHNTSGKINLPFIVAPSESGNKVVTGDGIVCYNVNIDLSTINSGYGASDTVMVDSFNVPVAIYLGS